jgi:hypothetical protein
MEPEGLTNQLTNCMELSPISEAAICAATQKLLNTSWDPKV